MLQKNKKTTKNKQTKKQNKTKNKKKNKKNDTLESQNNHLVLY